MYIYVYIYCAKYCARKCNGVSLHKTLLHCLANYSNSIEQSLSWQTTCYSAGQKLEGPLWNSEGHCCKLKPHKLSAC